MTSKDSINRVTVEQEFRKSTALAVGVLIIGVSALMYVGAVCLTGTIEWANNKSLIRALLPVQGPLLAIVVSVSILGVQSYTGVFSGEIRIQYFRSPPLLLTISIFTAFAIIAAITLLLPTELGFIFSYFSLLTYWFWLCSLISIITFVYLMPKLLLIDNLVRSYLHENIPSKSDLRTYSAEDVSDKLSEVSEIAEKCIIEGEQSAAVVGITQITWISDEYLRVFFSEDVPDDSINPKKIADNVIKTFYGMTLTASNHLVQALPAIAENYSIICTSSATFPTTTVHTSLGNGLLSIVRNLTGEVNVGYLEAWINLPTTVMDNLHMHHLPTTNLEALDSLVSVHGQILKVYITQGRLERDLYVIIPEMMETHIVAIKIILKRKCADSGSLSKTDGKTIKQSEKGVIKNLLDCVLHILNAVDNLDEDESLQLIDLLSLEVENVVKNSVGTKWGNLDREHSQLLCQIYIETMYLLNPSINTDSVVDTIDRWKQTNQKCGRTVDRTISKYDTSNPDLVAFPDSSSLNEPAIPFGDWLEEVKSRLENRARDSS